MMSFLLPIAIHFSNEDNSMSHMKKTELLIICSGNSPKDARDFYTVSLVERQILRKRFLTTNMDTVCFSTSVVPDHPPRDCHL